MLDEKLGTTTLTELCEEPKARLAPSETLGSAIGKMIKHRTQALPVFDGKKYEGMLSARDIVSSKNQPDKAKVKSALTRTPVLPEDTSVFDALHDMWSNSFRAIPVGEKDNPARLLTLQRILDWCIQQDEFKNMKAGDIDPMDYPTIGVHEEVDKARVALRDKELTKMLVGEAEANRLIGEKDYAEKISRLPRKTTTVGERSGEKTKRLGVDAQNATELLVVRGSRDDSLHKILNDMRYYNTVYAGVDGTLVTFRDVLRFLEGFRPAADLSKQKIAIISKHEFDPFTWKQMEKSLKSFTDFYDKRIGLDTLKELKVTVKSTNDEGRKTLYEMKANMITDLRNFHAAKSGWDPIEVFDDIISALKKQARLK